MQVQKSRVVNDPSVKWVSEHWKFELENKGNVPAFAFLDIPFDYAVSHRPGTRFGPESIIDALNGYSLYCPDKRVSLEKTGFFHLGSVDIVHSFEESYHNIQEAVIKIPQNFTPIFLGGDHSITDPIVRGMQKRLSNQKFGLIIFDAHFDSREPIKGKEHSGHWLKTLEDVVDYHCVVQLGINACIYSQQYMDIAEQKGVLVKTPYEIRKRGWEETIRESITHAMKGTKGLYISVDIDSIDQAFAPGTSVPNANGLFPYEIMDAIFEISSNSPVIGFDITEVSPPLDQQNFTSQLAAQIVINFIAGVVKSSNQ
jgi:agmatinase